MDRLLAVVLGVCLCLSAQAVLARVLVVGSVGDNAPEEIEEFLPLVRLLAARLAAQGVTAGQVRVARDEREMGGYLKRAQVDLYIDSPIPVVIAQGIAGGDIPLRRWKDGVAEYRSLVVVPRHSGTNTLADLRGRLLAFEEPFSSSGYLLPQADLQAQGLTLAHKSAVKDPVAVGEVGYVFSGDEENTLVWVMRGRVAAGALGDAQYRHLEPVHGGRLRVLYRTPPIPRHLVLFRQGLEPALAQSIRAELLRLHEDPQGREVLRHFSNTARFDALTPERHGALQSLIGPIVKARAAP